MAAPMEKTRHSGIYKRGSRYVAVWQNRGQQHKHAFRTLAEALEAKNNRQGGDRRRRRGPGVHPPHLRSLDGQRARRR
jgi:hypothetical protein